MIGILKVILGNIDESSSIYSNINTGFNFGNAYNGSSTLTYLTILPFSRGYSAVVVIYCHNSDAHHFIDYIKKHFMIWTQKMSSGKRNYILV